MASFRTRVFCVKLLLLDHGELVKCMNLDDELIRRDAAADENLDNEIKRQSRILEQYEREYSKVRAAAVVAAAVEDAALLSRW
jgi:hypothetical protein